MYLNFEWILSEILRKKFSQTCQCNTKFLVQSEQVELWGLITSINWKPTKIS